MTACNARPGPGEAFHGSGVACHLAAGHRAPHTWEVWAAGPWIATFDDGPLAYDDSRLFAVGPIWEEIVLVRVIRDPHQPMDPWAEHWTIVGGSGISEFETERVLWEGEVTYRLAEVVGMAGADGEPVAHYTAEGDA